MKPGLVWLLLIPFFELVWHFLVVSKVATSLAAEFNKRNLTTHPSPGKSIGLATCILRCCLEVVGVLTFSSSTFQLVYGLLALGTLICWISYWVEIAGYSRQLALPFTGSR